MRKLLGCLLCVMLLFLGVSSVRAQYIDLTATNPGYSTGAIYDYNTATDDSLWRAIDTVPTGTGVYQPFLRYQANGSEEGLNTNASPPPYDDKSPVGSYTRAILFDDVGMVNVGGTNYWSFTIDINEPATGGDLNKRFLSIDTYDIYQGDTAFATSTGELGTALFTSEDSILTDYTLASSGSGNDDIEFLIPVQAHTEDYMYLYITSGTFTGDPGGLGRSWTSEDGFEEVRTTGIPAVPEPASMFLIGFALVGLAGLKLRIRKS